MDNGAAFVQHIKWMMQCHHKNVFKRKQSPPIIVTSKTAFGGYIESILPPRKILQHEQRIIDKIKKMEYSIS